MTDDTTTPDRAVAYGLVPRHLWRTHLATLPSDARLVAMLALTLPAGGICPVCTVYEDELADLSGLSRRALRAALAALEVADLVHFDRRAGVLYAKVGLILRPPRGEKQVSAAKSGLDLVKSSPLVGKARQDIARVLVQADRETFQNPRRKAPVGSDTVSDGVSGRVSHTKAQAQAQAQGIEQAAAPAPPGAGAAAAGGPRTSESETERRARDGEARVRAAMSAQSTPAKLRAAGEPLVCEIVSALDDSPVEPERWGWACTYAIEHWSERGLLAPRMLVRVLVEDILPEFADRFAADRRTFGEREVARLARHEEQDARRRAEQAAEREAALAREQESYQATRQGDESIDAWRKRRTTEAHARYATLRRPTFDLRAPYVAPARRALTEDDDADGGDDLSEAAS